MRNTRFVSLTVLLFVAVLVPVLGPAPMSRVHAQGEVTKVDTSLPVPFTEEQAARGAMLYRRNCMYCHGASPMRSPFQTAYHLFARIRDGMPAWDIGAVSESGKLDIVAYLLKNKGFKPGSRELPMDVPALKKIQIAKAEPFVPEAGFTPIFNGRDFTNLKFFFGYNCTLPPSCGKTDPDAFGVKDGLIVAHGRHHGYMYTEQKYQNFDFRMDYRIEPPPDYDFALAEGAYINGGGLFLFLNDHRVWPAGIEIEGDNDRMLQPYGIAIPIESTWDKEAMLRANKGPGPWNSVQIVSKDGKVDVMLNGIKVAHISKHPNAGPGHIAVQYQGGTWMYRRLRIKAE